ncbi:MAG TPA: DUF72 domain-containing protein [Candidatus Acidoferrales bacterium]|nr:DUF72 domain-containing protein [Candidatus Acidoferrales bacterium]
MTRLYAGTSGWAYASWKPGFYPPKLASAKFLSYYATRLNTVEVNYTFRARVSAKLLAGWIQATPAHFKFAVKAHQRITHILRLHSAARSTSEFIASLEPLREADRLGPVLFQLPPFMRCDTALLEDFLATLPPGTRAAMEFRHTSWFVDPVYERLRHANVALCWAESEKLETPDISTADFRYFRLRKPEYSASARKALERRISDSIGKGDVFVYFKHEDTPEGAFYAEALGKNSKN